MITSMFLVYFICDRKFFFIGKSTFLEMTRRGILAKDAAAEPTATEWAS
jgi:hypothetical protein